MCVSFVGPVVNGGKHFKMMSVELKRQDVINFIVSADGLCTFC